MTPDTLSTISSINRSIVTCSRCPRLRAYCRRVARDKKREFADWTYWGKPVPGFGDPDARLLVVGLAPAAHGAVRAARQQAEPPRARALPSLSRRRATLAATRARGGDARPHCARELAQGGGVVAAARAARSATVRTRRREPPARWERRDRVVPPESAEHQHREAHPDDVVRGVSSGAGRPRASRLSIEPRPRLGLEYCVPATGALSPRHGSARHPSCDPATTVRSTFRWVHHTGGDSDETLATRRGTHGGRGVRHAARRCRTATHGRSRAQGGARDGDARPPAGRDRQLRRNGHHVGCD